jgi:hypothetical protein
MAYDQRSLDDYVDVATRITEFRDKHPEGTLQPASLTEPFKIIQVEGFEARKGGGQGDLITQTFIVYTAAAHRTPDDPRPGIGCAWEVFPGRTPYTRGSELMNAETSAWGRAIVAALAADSKRGVASREEVELARLRQDIIPRGPQGTDRTRTAPGDEDQWTGGPPLPTGIDEIPATSLTLQKIGTEMTRIKISDREARLVYCADVLGMETPPESSKNLTEEQARLVLAQLKAEVTP